MVVRRGRAYDQRLRRPVATASTGIAPADLDGVVTAAIPDDTLGGVSVMHIVRKWATDAW